MAWDWLELVLEIPFCPSKVVKMPSMIHLPWREGPHIPLGSVIVVSRIG